LNLPLGTRAVRPSSGCRGEKNYGWAKKKSVKGHRLSDCGTQEFSTYVATVSRGHVKRPGREIRISAGDTAVDAGLMRIRNYCVLNFEGAAVLAPASCAREKSPPKNGGIQQSNFNDYPVARINEGSRPKEVTSLRVRLRPAACWRAGRAAVWRRFATLSYAATGKARRNMTSLRGGCSVIERL